MQILNSIYSHLNFSDPKIGLSGNNEIKSSKPLKIKNYDELVDNVAKLSFHNKSSILFFRGQNKDYADKSGTIILPAIYRNTNVKPYLKARFDVLKEKSELFRGELRKRKPKFIGTSLLLKYQELTWAVFQHYEVCPTPLLDLTHSLHVACSFAFDSKKANNSAIIYVLGFPRMMDNISYSTIEELLNIRLLSICPPKARRPYFQEAYIAGPFPLYKLDSTRRKMQFDFSRRLIAKFEIPLEKSFWGSGFGKIPHDKLYQPRDGFREFLEDIGLK